MLIGIDGIALQFPHYRAGIYYYTQRVLEQLFAQDFGHDYRIYLSGSRRAECASVAAFVAPHAHVHCCRMTVPQRFFPALDRMRIPLALFMGGRTDLYFGPAYRIFPRSLYRRSVVTIHDLRFLLQPETFSDQGAVSHYSRLTREALARADALIAVSKFTADQLINDCGIVSDRVHVIHNGVGEEFFREIDAELLERFRQRYRLRDRYILFVGFIEQKKNLLRLIDAFSICRQRPGFPHQLVLAGPQGDYTATVIEHCRKRSIEKDVRLLGEVAADHLPALYQGAEIFAFPSLNEGFGLPPLEAMASGTAVVASNTTALPEVLGEAAWYVDPTDTENIAEGLYALARDDEARNQRVREGNLQARTYRWQNTAAKVQDLFKRL
jgi:glycosyltransferase involved in cell wall biosynthesis